MHYKYSLRFLIMVILTIMYTQTKANTFGYINNKLNSTIVIDTASIDTYSPEQMIDKTFCFVLPEQPYTADCFYNEEAIKTLNFSQKNIFRKNDHNVTPNNEFIDHYFKLIRIIKKGKDLTKGFVMQLKRDDGVIVGLKFNKYKSDKRYKKTHPSFSDLFYKSSFKYGPKYSIITGKDLKTWNTKIEIKVFDIGKLQDACDSISVKYFQKRIYPPYTGKIKNYTIDSISCKSTMVKVHMIENDSLKLSLNLCDFLKLYNNRKKDIKNDMELQKWICKYDPDQLAYIRENLIGNSVWALAGTAKKFYYFYKNIKDDVYKSNKDLWTSNSNFKWLHSTDIFGTAITNFSSSFFNVMNDYRSTNCIVDDLVLSENCLNKRTRNSKENAGTLCDNDFCFYLVLKQNQEKEYSRYGNNMNDSLSRLYIMLNEEDIKDYIISDTKNKENLARVESNEKMMNNSWQNSYNSVFDNYKRIWGEEIARIIQQGEVRFGFTSDMCLVAYRNNIYRTYNISTPLGIAECYDFYELGERLIFFDDELIGVQFIDDSTIKYSF